MKARSVWFVTVGLLALDCPASPQARNEPVITVNAGHVLRRFDHPPIGINVNHLMDEDSKRPPGSRPMAEALKDLGVRSLRFPEGELGDSYLWTDAPFPVTSAPRPRWALRGPKLWPSRDPRFSTPDFEPLANIMGFDRFMELCQATKAEPILIVAYDSAYKKVDPGSQKPTVEQLRALAVEWVRYANQRRVWNIRYWEIGNETDINPEAHSGADPGTHQYATDVITFSRSMKAVDPSIKIGVNVWNNQRLAELLRIPSLWPAVDFVSLHNYPTMKWSEGYERFRTTRPDLTRSIREANDLVDKSDLSPEIRRRLEFLVTETAPIDWAKKNGWPNVADHGHGLVQFDLIGQTLKQPRITSLQQWVTRWIHNDEPSRPLKVYDALDPRNQLTPLGEALGIWGRHLQPQLVEAQGTDSILAYASLSDSGDRLVVFLLNRERTEQTARLDITNFHAAGGVWTQSYFAASPEAERGQWSKRIHLSPAPTQLRLPPLSISVFDFRAAPVAP